MQGNNQIEKVIKITLKQKPIYQTYAVFSYLCFLISNFFTIAVLNKKNRPKAIIILSRTKSDSNFPKK